MSATHRIVTDTELEILKALWKLGEGNVREVLEELAPQGRDWAYTTAQTMLTRLQEKGIVAREKRGRAFVFRAVFTRDQLLESSLDDLASRVCDGKTMPLLLNLVRSPGFSKEELQRFRGMLDELERKEGGES